MKQEIKMVKGGYIMCECGLYKHCSDDTAFSIDTKSLGDSCETATTLLNYTCKNCNRVYHEEVGY